MATLKEIKRRILSVESTKQITKAMKMVAASKLRKAQTRMYNTRPYAQKLKELISFVLPKVEMLEQPLVTPREVERICVVVITADRGLCGAFNSNIIRKSLTYISELKEKYQVDIFPIGRKGYEFFSKRDYQIVDKKINFFNNLEYDHAVKISESLIELYTSNKYDQIFVVFNEFKSALQQNQLVEQYLPISVSDQFEETETESSASLIEPLFDPGKEELLNSLIPKNLIVQFWRYLVESNAAEEAARMAAMENATENAIEIINDLTILYNRSRQAAITTEIAEIVGGAEALKE